MIYLSEVERNQRFEILKKNPQNQHCVDCNAKFPNWASASFGILICMDCSARHRSYGPQISFVRSLTMDHWTEKELYSMEIGGNKKFLEYLKKRQIQKPQYSSEDLINYKRQLEEKISQKFQDQKLPEKMEENQKENIVKKQENFEDQEKKISEREKIVFDLNKGEENTNQNQPIVPLKKKKKQLGGNKIDKQIDFNSLVTDDLKIDTKNVQKQEEVKIVKKVINTGLKTENPSINEKEEKIDYSKIGQKTGYGSDDLLVKENQKIQMTNYKIGSGFGSDQIEGVQEETNKGNFSETPFGNFLSKASNKVKNQTYNLISNIKEKINK